MGKVTYSDTLKDGDEMELLFDGELIGQIKRMGTRLRIRCSDGWKSSVAPDGSILFIPKEA
jgi:hypothetical protein